MKRATRYLFCFFLVIFSSCRKGEVDSDCMGDAKEVACYLNYDPVCGCNGTTYSNECVANAAGVKSFVPGKCK